MYSFYYYCKHYDYPENLFRAILESDDERYASDIGERLIDVLLNDEIFSDRSRDVVELYFSNGFNLKEIGSIFDVTQERVRQIILKELRKLRMRVRMNFIKNGGEHCYQIRDFRRSIDVFEINIQFWTVNGVSMDFIKHDKMSVRIEKAMTRKGIKTFDEILKLNGRRDFYEIRNIGNTSIARIIENFEYLGINVDRFKEVV